jgi:hypothetical protein
MALTNLEARHIRLMKKAIDIVNRRRTMGAGTSLANPAFFDAILADDLGLFSGQERAKISESITACSFTKQDELVLLVFSTLITRISVLALYPDRVERKAKGIKRGLGAVHNCTLPKNTEETLLYLAIMVCEYVSVMRTIRMSSLGFRS